MSRHFELLFSRSLILSLVSCSNPMLAETFEDPRMKFISEKVCHQPVILAYHCEGEGWEHYASSSGKTKFWGMWFHTL